MRYLITGITGFAGGHLAEALLVQPGAEVVGISREGTWPAHLAHLAGRVTLHPCDLCVQVELAHLLGGIIPDGIFHLAGQADVGRSLQHPEEAWRDNLLATRSLYQALDHLDFKPRLLYVGSGLAYGDPRHPDQVFDEESPFYPPHPYAASKAAADLMSYQYSRFPGLPIIRARPFNHIGPRQAPQFAIAHFARQIAAIELGLQEPVVHTGNLEARRDVTDVRDIVRAYQLLLERGRPGEAYNIATGNNYTMRDLLDRLLRSARVQVEVRWREQLTRATESPTVRASSARLRQETGWAPDYSLEQSLEDTLNYWRRQLQAESESERK
jgi:GDP-4-dehydro-6-deoxy-D-mannose reductase